MKKILVIALLVLVAFGFGSSSKDSNYNRPITKAPQVFNPGTITPSQIDDAYVSYTDFIVELEEDYDLDPLMDNLEVVSLADNRYIRIDTADELYRFSVDVSFHEELATDDPTLTNNFTYEIKKGLLSLNYVLGDDIDYSGMKSRQFIPVGYSYVNASSQLIENVFKGTFDGRGFEISNLYLANIDYLLYEDDSTGIILTYNLTNYYSMFSYNEGTIKSLGLINPTLELLEYSSGLRSAANLVGLNRASGTVEDVYVRDTRLDPFDAGIRMRVPSGTASLTYTAAGVIHTNLGEFSNAYFAASVVVNASNISSWDYEPVVLNNNKPKNMIAFDDTIYVKTIVAPGINYNTLTPDPLLATPEETSVLQSVNSSIYASGDWHVYGSNYPILLGLDYVGGKYVIRNALDFVAFSKMLKYTTPVNGKALYDSDFIITDDIDMSHVAKSAYRVPDIEFTGSLDGDNSGSNRYIKNLVLTNGIVTTGNYSSGLFRSVGASGEIKNITFSNAQIILNNTEVYYSSVFRVGLITASLNGGSITNVYANVNIDLGTKPIGQSFVGGIVGQASGTLERVYVEGLINGGNHTTSSEYSINPSYSIGGIVGSHRTSKLTILQAINDANITGIGYTSNVTLQSGAQPRVYMGGIIGRVTNTTTVKHSFRQLENNGDITIGNLRSTGVIQYAGGVFGNSSGVNYDWNSVYSSSVVAKADLVNEVWVNNGDIKYSSTSNNGTIKTAGIGVSSHSEAVEFVYLNNNGNYTSDSFGMFKYTGLIYNESNFKITISQSINNTDFTFTSYVNNFSPIYYSEQTAPALLRFVENAGDIIYKNFSNTIGDLNIAGISQYSNVDMLNVYFSGRIIVYDVSSTFDIWVSGFTKELASGRYIKNSLNEGEIYTSAINSTKNIYVGGIVNTNNSGDLHTSPNSTSNTPKATIGITNTINYAPLLSFFSEAGYSNSIVSNSNGINGTGNVFAGGIATLNNGSIQDTVNMGDIKFTHLNNLDKTVISMETSLALAGLIKNYSGGVVLGGVSSMVIGPNSRIYDASNSGNIYAIAKNFTRSGGILGVSLFDESVGGGVLPVESNSTLLTTKRNQIASSILSNSINYGDIIAITESISEYTPGNPTYTTLEFFPTSYDYTAYTRPSTADRPGIYASAGGVIGYGLSVMRRMLNHGKVLSTDVAGGVVGATYVIGNGTTIVNINTAINYGGVQAVKTTAFAALKDIVNPTINNINGTNNDNLYRFDNPTEVLHYFPNTVSDITKFPENKRGFGGIFGRLQRGTDGYMTSVGGSFNYIVNADPNVDLIGRLDQVINYTSSARFFIFRDNIYYSARPNDTTQAVFSGYRYPTSISKQAYVTTKTTTVVRTGSWYYTWTMTETYNLNPGVINKSVTGNIVIGGDIVDTYSTVTQESKSTHVVVSSQSGLFLSNPFTYSEGTTNETINNNIQFSESITGNNINSGSTIEKPLITENPLGSGEYIYDEDFVMRDDSVLINNTPITSYIYYVRGEVLSDTFQTARPNGMYVLTTTAGSTVGSVLPANMNVTSIYNLSNPVYPGDDYSSIGISNKQVFDEEIETVYEDLFQTKYNDKSELLETNQDIYLEEINGDGTKIIDGEVTAASKRVDFSISLNNFSPSLISTYFKVGSANISDKALLASSNYSAYFDGENTLTLEEFQDNLHLEKDAIISTLLIPDLSVTFANVVPNTPYRLGSFRVYSEAAINDTYFLDSSRIDVYSTEYDVYITFSARVVEEEPIVISNINIDGINVNLTNYETNYNDYPINNYMTITFSDSSNLLQVGKDMKHFFELYYSTYLVDNIYYTITDGIVYSGGFSVTISPGNQISSGDYVLKYKYFAYESFNEIDITNGESTVGEITDIEYYSYCDFSIYPVGNLETDIKFGYELVNGPISIDPVVNESIKPFLSRTTYTVYGIEDFKISISNFAKLTNIAYSGKDYDENNYAVYTFIYTVESESGDPYTYTHVITEEEIEITTIYKNNNAVDEGNIYATREVDFTIFAVEFNIDNSIADVVYNLNSANGDYFAVNVVKDSDPLEQVLGITFFTDNLLFIRMSDLTLPGDYTFTFNYIRDNGGVTLQVGSIVITKQEGLSSYLRDMKFTEFLSTRYPIVYEANNDGTKKDSSTYIMNVYFNGIDYNGADSAGVKYIRIDGFVPNIPLESYRPRITEFLPAGATVSLGNLVDGIWVPTYLEDGEVAKGASEEELSKLNANFGEETVGGNKVITYRVISEDKEQTTYYFVTVTDVLYNVSLIFEVYFMVGGVEVLASQTTEFNDKLILLNVSNFVAYNEGVLQDATEALAISVDDFLDFDEVNSYNNSISQFYVPTTANYKYAFGRNLSGFYQISLNLPKTITGLNIYQYTVRYNDEDLPLMISKYDELDLPTIPQKEKEGFYYYVEKADRNRTRTLKIVINKLEIPSGNPYWGLTDYYNSWD